MRSFVKALSGIVGAVALLLVYMGYMIPFFMEHQTKITANEIVIGRLTGFGTSMRYAIERRTGNEKILLKSRKPFAESVWYTIEYAADCSCVDKVHKLASDGFYIKRSDNGLAYYVREGIAFDTRGYVTLESVKDKFAEAKAIRDDIRKQYDHLIPR